MLYAVFGTSRIGSRPVAVVSLILAPPLPNIVEQGTMSLSQFYHWFVRCYLVGDGVVPAGVCGEFFCPILSFPVSSPHQGINIAASQLKHILGINAEGHNLLELVISSNTSETN
jgi:SulP family sulfate permease